MTAVKGFGLTNGFDRATLPPRARPWGGEGRPSPAAGCPVWRRRACGAAPVCGVWEDRPCHAACKGGWRGGGLCYLSTHIAALPGLHGLPSPPVWSGDGRRRKPAAAAGPPARARARAKGTRTDPPARAQKRTGSEKLHNQSNHQTSPAHQAHRTNQFKPCKRRRTHPPTHPPTPRSGRRTPAWRVTARCCASPWTTCTRWDWVGLGGRGWAVGVGRSGLGVRGT